MELVGTFQSLHSGNYIVRNFVIAIYFKLGLMSHSSFVNNKSTEFAIVTALWCVILTFWASGFIENGFNTMLHLGLSIPRLEGSYKIYTKFFPWHFVQNYHYFVWPCTPTDVFSWLNYCMTSYLFTMTNSGYIQLLVTHHLLQIPSSKERNI